MFGVTIEKLFLVALVAAVVIGPQRFAHYTRGLTDTIRSLRGFVEATRIRAEHDLGMPLTRAEWERLDLRRYDPRAIVREALEDSPPVAGAGPMPVGDALSTLPSPNAQAGPSRDEEGIPQTGGPVTDAASSGSSSAVASALEGLDRIRPGQKHLVVGDSAHPRRIPLGSLPADDPRRIAGERVPADDNATVVAAG